MKKIVILTAAILITSATHVFSQDSLSSVLTAYYQLKDALITGDATAAAGKAGTLLQSINNINTQKLSPKEQKAFSPLKEKLSFDARHISEKKQIDHQREHFAALSDNMYTLARTVPLTSQPVYRDYCPMKKVYWLSAEQPIKNPYYGNTMLSCGKVTETLRP